jgi:hypothetical protein
MNADPGFHRFWPEGRKFRMEYENPIFIESADSPSVQRLVAFWKTARKPMESFWLKLTILSYKRLLLHDLRHDPRDNLILVRRYQLAQRLAFGELNLLPEEPLLLSPEELGNCPVIRDEDLLTESRPKSSTADSTAPAPSNESATP